MTTKTTAAKFETGKTYEERSIANWDCIFRFKIVRRTAKTVWFTEGDSDEVRKCRVSIGYDGHEVFRPHGTYSMCCVVNAGRS